MDTDCGRLDDDELDAGEAYRRRVFRENMEAERIRRELLDEADDCPRCGNTGMVEEWCDHGPDPADAICLARPCTCIHARLR